MKNKIQESIDLNIIGGKLWLNTQSQVCVNAIEKLFHNLPVRAKEKRKGLT